MQIIARLVKWSFKHASNVTTIPIGCSDDRCKQVADIACVPYSVYGSPAADENSVLAQAYEY